MRCRVGGGRRIINDGIALSTGRGIRRTTPRRQSFDFRRTSGMGRDIVDERSGRQLWCVVTRGRHLRLLQERGHRSWKGEGSDAEESRNQEKTNKE